MGPMPPSSVAPNLVDRLFLLLDGLQGSASLNLYWLGLAGDLEREALSEALAEALERTPVLRSTVIRGAWGFRRTARPLTPGDLDALLGWDETGSDEVAFALHRRPWDMARDLPIRLLVQRLPAGGSRLVAAMHHSATDAMGGYFFLDRLAAHYGARLAGEAPPAWPAPPATRSYLAYWRTLPLGLRLRGYARALGSFRELTAAQPACATFGDQPLPARGAFAWTAVAVPEALGPALRAWARAGGGTLRDLLLAAVAVAGTRTWPQDGPLPVVAMVPSNLRDGVPTDVANRVAEVPVRLPAEAAGALEAAFAAATAATAVARDRPQAFARIAERGLASRLPPGLFRRAVGTHLDRSPNRTMSLVFSNLGVVDAFPRDFGPVRVTAVGGAPPLTMPPGLAVVPATRGGRLVLTLAWLEPALAAESVRRFAATTLEILESAAVDPGIGVMTPGPSLVRSAEDC